MPQITLFHAPFACSRVTLTALETVGIDFGLQIVDLDSDEQYSPQYLSVNPSGKVPALRVGDDVLAENSAILHYLHRQHPAAGLLPPDDEIPTNAGLQDLVWCSATLHPMTRQIRMPIRFTAGDTSGVKADGLNKWASVLKRLSSRLSDGRWWYGARWSIVDVYLFWNYSTAMSGGLSIDDHPAVREHMARVMDLPAFQGAMKREEEAWNEGGSRRAH